MESPHTFQTAFDCLKCQDACSQRHDRLLEECRNYGVEVLRTARGEDVVAEALIPRVVQALEPASQIFALFICQVIWQNTLLASRGQASNERVRSDADIVVGQIVTVDERHHEDEDGAKFVIHGLIFPSLVREVPRSRLHGLPWSLS